MGAVKAGIGRGLAQAGVLVLASGVLAAMAAWMVPMEPIEEGEISLESALKRRPQPLWIDARSAPEYLEEHVPGALALNEADWSALVPGVLKFWEPGQTAVVYCDAAGGQASREVAARLREFHLGPVYVLRGGWKAWKQK